MKWSSYECQTALFCHPHVSSLDPCTKKSWWQGWSPCIHQHLRVDYTSLVLIWLSPLLRANLQRAEDLLSLQYDSIAQRNWLTPWFQADCKHTSDLSLLSLSKALFVSLQKAFFINMIFQSKLPLVKSSFFSNGLMPTELTYLTHMSHHPEVAGLTECRNRQQKVQLCCHLGHDTCELETLFTGCSMCLKWEANPWFHPSYSQNILVWDKARRRKEVPLHYYT